MPMKFSSISFFIGWLTLAAPTAMAQDQLSGCFGKDLDTSISACTELLSSKPEESVRRKALIARAVRYAARANYVESIADYDGLLAVEPDNTSALNGRAASHLKLGRLADAKADVARSKVIDPKNPLTLTVLSTVAFAEGDLQATIDFASQAIGLDSRQSAAYANRASAYRETGRYQEALNDYNAALRLNPYASRVLYQRGLTHFRMTNYDQALIDYKASAALNPRDEEVSRGIEEVERRKAAVAQPARPIDAPPRIAEAPPGGPDRKAVKDGATGPDVADPEDLASLCSDYSEDHTLNVILENRTRGITMREMENKEKVLEAREKKVAHAQKQRRLCPAWKKVREQEAKKMFTANLRAELVNEPACAPFRSQIESISSRLVGHPELEQRSEAAMLQMAMGQKDSYCKTLGQLIGPYLELRDVASRCNPSVAMGLHQTFGSVAQEARQNGCR
ncbi:tetratricopeptide repeat protein [Methylorubrum extorquens]|jgi:tetratricopeptide (TPR) repeat protein|uniref:tetratricopeptide repeat protein n=1 Tax=Methylorubrum extorquens TaxID=408 RepID=UPI0009E5CCA7|nr:tetratricopeptide repeat protein [Methylorubrum extorquens]MCP1545415.1 tetratricopeptide (TPR) repeat protein [Methylorubrum extorquens]MCP1591367.1 tetratricopeptide (TPR) repeat protein [Methylorubrum extorquens]